MDLQILKSKIQVVRGQRVMLDFDLAAFYEVPVKALNQAVKRNMERFPEDFMFELSREEYQALRSQIVTLEPGRGKYSKYNPYVFTEHGVAMLSSVLKSDRAIQINIAIMRAFVTLRQYALTYTELAQKIKELESRFEREFADVNEVLRWLGEENQARSKEIEQMGAGDAKPDPWEKRSKIGFKKDP